MFAAAAIFPLIRLCSPLCDDRRRYSESCSRIRWPSAAVSTPAPLFEQVVRCRAQPSRADDDVVRGLRTLSPRLSAVKLTNTVVRERGGEGREGRRRNPSATWPWTPRLRIKWLAQQVISNGKLHSIRIGLVHACITLHLLASLCIPLSSINIYTCHFRPPSSEFASKFGTFKVFRNFYFDKNAF